ICGSFFPAARRAWTKESRSRTMTSGGNDRAIAPSLLHERDLVDLAQGRLSFLYFEQRRLAEEGHPLLLRRMLDLRGRPAVEDHGADAVGEVEQLRDRGA